MSNAECARGVTVQSDFSDIVLPPLPDVPGMIKSSEARYLYWLASTRYTGRGAVVELGSFLGKSAIHLAAGLRDGRRGGALHCFDRFRWDADHAAKFDLGLELGDDYRAHFEANVRAIDGEIHAHSCELGDLEWREGPVEILFVDAPKKLRELLAVFETFAPDLAPDGTWLAFQDFAHATSYAVPLVIAGLGDRLELAHVVAGGSTATFRLRAPLPRGDAAARELDFRAWSPTGIAAAIDGLAERIEALDVRRKLLAGVPFALWDRGDRDAATARARALEFDDDLQRHWTRMAEGKAFERYDGIFLARGFARAALPRRAERRTIGGWVRRWIGR